MEVMTVPKGSAPRLFSRERGTSVGIYTMGRIINSASDVKLAGIGRGKSFAVLRFKWFGEAWSDSCKLQRPNGGVPYPHSLQLFGVSCERTFVKK